MRLLPLRCAVHEHDHVDGSVQGRLQRPAEDNVKTAERHRRVGDSTPRHRSLPTISLPVPNAWQQGARQSSTLLLCGFPHQEFIHEAGGSVEEINVVCCGKYSYSESRRTRGKNCCSVKVILWSASSLSIRARGCATNESMVSAANASRYSIADECRHSLVIRGEGGIFRRYKVLAIHQANTQIMFISIRRKSLKGARG